MRRASFGLAVLAVTLLGIACSEDLGSGQSDGTRDAVSAADYEFYIPRGAGQRASAGETLTIFPDQLNVRVGETIRIVNDDDVVQRVGPFVVMAGQTLEERFAVAGTYVGECSTHPKTGFTLVVSP